MKFGGYVAKRPLLLDIIILYNIINICGHNELSRWSNDLIHQNTIAKGIDESCSVKMGFNEFA